MDEGAIRICSGCRRRLVFFEETGQEGEDERCVILRHDLLKEANAHLRGRIKELEGEKQDAKTP